jgi:gliding motility-associated-like protein
MQFLLRYFVILRKSLKKMQFWEKSYSDSASFFQPLLLLKKAKRVSLFCLFSGSTAFVSAQQISDNQCENQPGVGSGGMRITDPVGCISHTVKVANNQNGSTKSRYIYDYKGGNPNNSQVYKPDTATSFTYTKPGLYIIMQLSESAFGQPLRSCQRVTIQDPIPPTFKILPCENGKVTLMVSNHELTQYEEYVIEWGDGNVAIINRLNLSAQYQYKDLSPKQISVQGRHSVSKCGGKSTRTVTLAIGNQPAILSKLEVLDANTAELTISNPNLFDLELYRQDGTGQFQNTGKVLKNANEKTKVAIDTTKLLCYKLKPRDSCIASLESNVLCVSYLTAVPDISYNTIAVEPYRYPSEITKMTVSRNNTTWWNPNFTDLFRDDSQAECGKKTCYRLQLDTRNGTVLSNTICIDPPPALCVSLANVYIPDAFTPNGDGINDFFEVKGEPTSEIQILIYDRWGIPVFQNSINVRHWNGTVNGQAAPPGAYFYRISVTDKIGRNFVKRGSFSLLR